VTAATRGLNGNEYLELYNLPKTVAQKRWNLWHVL